MANDKISKSITEIHAHFLDFTIPANDQRVFDITAPVPSGYSFLAWVYATSSGWTGFVYPSQAGSQTTAFWTLETSENARNVRGWFLYYK